MNKNSISAVTFTYNEQKYIGDLIDSIISQTVYVEKIIICDDFSTDETREIIAEKTQEYKNHTEIKLLKNINKGKVFAYEMALSRVDTDYFFVCGGDDVIANTYVEDMLNFIKINGIDFSYANPLWCNEHLIPFRRVKKKPIYQFNDLFYANWVGGFIFAHSKVINDFLPFPVNLEFEDWYVGMLLSKKYKKIHINLNACYYYRRHVDAATSVSSHEKSIYLVERDIRFYNFFHDMGVNPKLIEAKKIALRSRVYILSFYDIIRLMKTFGFSGLEKMKVLYYQLFRRSYLKNFDKS